MTIESRKLKPSMALIWLSSACFPIAMMAAPLGLIFLSGNALWTALAASPAFLILDMQLSRYMYRLAMLRAECMSEEFWKWFVENEKDFRELSPHDRMGQVEAMQRTGEWLRQNIHPNLECEIGFPAEPGGLNTLVFSAGGERFLVSFIEPLIAKAPKLEGWELVMLKQRKGVPPVVLLNGKEYQVEDFAYTLSGLDDKGRLNMIFYIRGYNVEEAKFQLIGAAYIFLESIIGEKDAMEGVALAFTSMEDGKLPPNVRPIAELAMDFDQRRAQGLVIQA
ncbi:MAG: hypothetical protein ACAI35_15520 [Candidatus Methylacidiphilales bacterium]|nr:hypothetical protein [Candidatus Methylacidiphilales bacterium]